MFLCALSRPLNSHFQKFLVKLETIWFLPKRPGKPEADIQAGLVASVRYPGHLIVCWTASLLSSARVCFTVGQPSNDRLLGLLVKASATNGADPGFDSRGRDFSGLSHTSDLKLAPLWLPWKAPGVIGSALGLARMVRKRERVSIL